MTIDKCFNKSLTKDEVTELTKFLEAVELKEYYASGYKNINGGYAEVEVTDIIGDYEETGDIEFDMIEFRLESGVQDMGSGSSSTDSCLCRISMLVINDTNLSIQEKMAKIEED